MKIAKYRPKHAVTPAWIAEQIRDTQRQERLGRHRGEICYRSNNPDIPRIVGNHEQENPASSN